MAEEISDAINEQQFKKAALALMKSKHSHADGSEVVLTPLEDYAADLDSIERRVAEQENEWKQIAGQKESQPAFPPEEKPQRKQQLKEEFATERKKQAIMAGCNCGKTLFGSFSDSSNPSKGSFDIKSYSASGASETISYSASGSSGQKYSPSGDVSSGYGSQGKVN